MGLLVMAGVGDGWAASAGSISPAVGSAARLAALGSSATEDEPQDSAPTTPTLLGPVAPDATSIPPLLAARIGDTSSERPWFGILLGTMLLALAGFGAYAGIGSRADSDGAAAERGEALPAVVWLVAALAATIAGALWVLIG